MQPIIIVDRRSPRGRTVLLSGSGSGSVALDLVAEALGVPISYVSGMPSTRPIDREHTGGQAFMTFALDRAGWELPGPNTTRDQRRQIVGRLRAMLRAHPVGLAITDGRWTPPEGEAHPKLPFARLLLAKSLGVPASYVSGAEGTRPIDREHTGGQAFMTWALPLALDAIVRAGTDTRKVSAAVVTLRRKLWTRTVGRSIITDRLGGLEPKKEDPPRELPERTTGQTDTPPVQTTTVETGGGSVQGETGAGWFDSLSSAEKGMLAAGAGLVVLLIAKKK